MKFLRTIALYLGAAEAAVIGKNPIIEPEDFSLTVDLGYGIYKGFYNSTTDLKIWKGYVAANFSIGSFLVISICSLTNLPF